MKRKSTRNLGQISLENKLYIESFKLEQAKLSMDELLRIKANNQKVKPLQMKIDYIQDKIDKILDSLSVYYNKNKD
jgi:hypothetical protein